MIKYLDKKDNFEDLTRERCLVDFYADWCGPCKMLGSVLEEVEKEIKLPIIKVNTDAFQDLSIKFGVMSIPTILIIEKGIVIRKHIGYMSKEELKKFIA